MQGLFIEGQRPKTKKAVKEAIAVDPASVSVEDTSWFPNGDYSGSLADAPVGTKVHFVGPDPHTLRNFYGSLHVTSAGVKVS